VDAKARREKGGRGVSSPKHIVNAMDRGQRAKIGARRGRPKKQPHDRGRLWRVLV
jgi:hypothetical protein